MLLGVTLPKALPVQAHLAYMNPELKLRPLAMAMNGVILILSLAMAALYWMFIRKVSRKLGVRS